MAAGTVTAVEERLGQIQKITFAWVAGTDASAGTASGSTTYSYTGAILACCTVPSGAAAPTDGYDLTVTDADSIDVLRGNGANRDTAVTEWATGGRGLVVGDKLTLNVSNAGSATAGTTIVYVGMGVDIDGLSSWPQTVDVTIANGESLSGAVDLNGMALVGLIMPAAWTAANLTVALSIDNSTYNNLYDSNGNEYLITAAASRRIIVPASDLPAVKWLKIRSGTSGAAVAQGGARVITLLARQI